MSHPKQIVASADLVVQANEQKVKAESVKSLKLTNQKGKLSTLPIGLQEWKMVKMNTNVMKPLHG